MEDTHQKIVTLHCKKILKPFLGERVQTVTMRRMGAAYGRLAVFLNSSFLP